MVRASGGRNGRREVDRLWVEREAFGGGGSGRGNLEGGGLLAFPVNEFLGCVVAALGCRTNRSTPSGRALCRVSTDIAGVVVVVIVAENVKSLVAVGRGDAFST